MSEMFVMDINPSKKGFRKRKRVKSEEGRRCGGAERNEEESALRRDSTRGVRLSASLDGGDLAVTMDG